MQISDYFSSTPQVLYMIRDNSRVQVPNTPLQLEVLAEDKGVHREVESEGSLRQTLGLTDRNYI